jgi:predicted amidohydrolase YtcJ
MPVPSKESGLLLEHANIITLDPNRPRAEAVLCREGVIEAVGSNEELDELVREGDVRFDCGELTLVPGFIDSHTHFMAMGLNALRVDLTEVPDRDGLLDKLAERAGDTPEGEWVYGVGFDESGWSGDHTLPTREELDSRVSSDHPVVARRICGHIGVANTMAIERIGEGWEEVDPESGLLLEDVVLRLSEVVGVTGEEARKAVELATGIAYRNGVTSVVDMTDLRTMRTYLDLATSGELGVRVFCTVQARDLPVIESAEIGVRRDGDLGMFRFVGIKAFLDGSLGARTAALGVPYADDPDDPGNMGKLLFGPEELRDLVRRCEDAGLQLFLHAIGDRAIGAALDAIEAEAAPGNPLRHRIEHLECVTKVQLDRAKDLRVVASMQPNFIVQWSGEGRLNEQRLGPERARRSEGLRDVWSRGIPLAFGSDGMPFGPLYGLQGAVDHPVEEQSLPPMVALRAYTEGSAWSVHAGNWLGTIEQGKAADLALIDQDLDTSPDLREANVVLTVLGGFLVHVDGDAFNEAVNKAAQLALEEALMSPDDLSVDTDAPNEEDEGEDE